MTSEARTESKQNGCVVVENLKMLRRQLQLKEHAPVLLRTTLARAARIVTEVSLGRGTVAQLKELENLAQELAFLDATSADALAASLRNSFDEWQSHVSANSCSAGVCFQPRTVPCQEACPAHIDIPSMIAHIGHGQYEDALSILLKDTPLPNSCGLVCPAPCEDACVQKTVSAAVVIRPMKSVAARCSPSYPLPERAAPTGKKVAIVGSGPAGLTAAYYLAQKGHQVEIFDEREHAGGIMRYGIPHYRLPAEVLNSEIDMVKSLGVSIHTGRPVSNVKGLLSQGFDASFLATGLQNSKGLGVTGEDQPFVLGGMDFLSKVRAGENPRVGPHVIVIGGGNAAIDVAMTSLRQGATKVQMWYRRTRKDMPANPHEVEMALAEGVELIEYWAPTRILPGNLIEFVRSKNAPDAATAQPVTVHADQIIAGIGQEADLSWLEGSGIETKWGNIVADPVTLATGEPGIFAGGDIGHGASTVVAAIGSGKRAAESIHAYLTGTEMNHAALLSQRRDDVPAIATDAAARTNPMRPHVPERTPEERKHTHQPIQYDFDEKVAQAEAGRCLRCDQCIGCGLCELVCAEVGVEALRMIETPSGRLAFEDFIRPASLCIGCGACAAVCPTGAISVENRDGYRVTEITGTVVRRQAMSVCESCNEPFVSASQHDKMRSTLGGHASGSVICLPCARSRAVETMQDMYHHAAL
jgi:NADPH-dependent glutamate synthase beta subunit-like oxidoreductase